MSLQPKCAMSYRFRLRIASKQDGKFAFPSSQQTIALNDELVLSVVARNAETLDKATAFHLEAGGFPTEAAARQAGEALRVRLRLLNVILGLGLNVPVGDSPSGSVSDDIKRKVAEEKDAVIVDSVWGVSTFPDDERHFECVLSGTLVVRPSDPSYLLTALKTIWPLDIHLDRPSEDALHVLGLATLETSEKAAFLTSYLALEHLIERAPRSEAAKALITRFQAQVKKASARKYSPLSKSEAGSLDTALAALHEESFTGALMRFARRVKTPTKIKGMPPDRFFSACIKARNQIAHNAEPSTKVPLLDLTGGLREVVVGLIWNRNNLPPFSITTPPSAVTIPAGGMSIRVL